MCRCRQIQGVLSVIDVNQKFAPSIRLRLSTTTKSRPFQPPNIIVAIIISRPLHACCWGGARKWRVAHVYVLSRLRQIKSGQGVGEYKYVLQPATKKLAVPHTRDTIARIAFLVRAKRNESEDVSASKDDVKLQESNQHNLLRGGAARQITCGGVAGGPALDRPGHRQGSKKSSSSSPRCRGIEARIGESYYRHRSSQTPSYILLHDQLTRTQSSAGYSQAQSVTYVSQQWQ